VRLNGLDKADYWSNAFAAVPRSPSFDFSGGHAEEVEVLGNYDAQGVHRMVFTRVLPSEMRAAAAAAAGARRLVGVCRAHRTYGRSRLICSVPRSSTYFAATMSLQKRMPGRQEEEEWVLVAHKVCFQRVCGNEPYELRVHDSSQWWHSNGVLRGDLSGSIALFRFTLPSLVFQQDAMRGGGGGGQNLSLVLGNASSCALHADLRSSPYQAPEAHQHTSCFFDTRTCSDGGKQGAVCSTDADCEGTDVAGVCSSTWQFKLKGVAALTSFKHGGEEWLFVSNFWDGVTLRVKSLVLRITSAHNMQVVQEISTVGARDCLHLQPHANLSLLAVANFGGDVVLYPLRASSSTSTSDLAAGDVVETSELGALRLKWSFATALASFKMGEWLVLAVACFSQGHSAAPSALFAISGITREEYNAVFDILDKDSNGFVAKDEIHMSSAASDTASFDLLDKNGDKIISRKEWEAGDASVTPRMAARPLAQIHTQGAVNVEHLVLGGVDYLFFATQGPAPSPLFRVTRLTTSSRTLSLQLVQQMPCAGSSVYFAFASGAYLVVAEADEVALYRWNDTAMVSVIDSHTLPKDSAGGQRLAAAHIAAILALPPRRLNGSSEMQLIFGAKNPASDGGGDSVYNSSLWHSWQESISCMRGPSALALTPDATSLLVVCSGSRSIVALERNRETGALLYRPHPAGYLTAWCLGNMDARTATPRHAVAQDGKEFTKEQLGYPLRAVSGIAVSPDGRTVYTSCMADNLVAVFAFNASSRVLELVQVVAEAVSVSNAGGRFGLLGASSLSLSASGDILFVASRRGVSLSVWRCNPTAAAECGGCLSFVDRVRQGERRPNTFRLLDSPVTPQRRGSPWALSAGVSLSAVDGVSFVVAGQAYLAVALSGLSIAPDDSSDKSAVCIYRVRMIALPGDQQALHEEEAVNSTITLIQRIPERAAAIAVFSLYQKRDETENHYLAVGSGLQWSPSRGLMSGSLSLFRWKMSTGSFELDHMLPLPGENSNTGFGPDVGESSTMHASSIHAFEAASGQQLLAVAFDTSVSAQAASCIYRWSQDYSTRTDTAAATPRFEIVHCLPCTHAVRIETSWFHDMQLLVVASEGLDSDTQAGGQVDIYKVSFDGRKFDSLQSIVSPGLSDACLVTVDTSEGNGMLLLVVGIQRALPAASYGPHLRPLAAYDQTSKIYRWQALDLWGPLPLDEGLFVLHQELDGQTLTSVMQDYGIEYPRATPNDRAVAEAVFCGYGNEAQGGGGKVGLDCDPAEDASSLAVPHLRGVSGTDAFKSNGETYLTLAQSVCSRKHAACPISSFYDRPMPQPKSTVLQWNRKDERFGDMLAVEDNTWRALSKQRVPLDQVNEHSFALRLSAGRARGFRYFEAGDRKVFSQRASFTCFFASFGKCYVYFHLFHVSF